MVRTVAVRELIAQRFRALGDPTRLGILQLLLEREHTVQDLVQALGTSQANVSKHLDVLERAGFIARRRDGTRTWCRVTDPSLPGLCHLVCERFAEQIQEQTALLDQAHQAFAAPAAGRLQSVGRSR